MLSDKIKPMSCEKTFGFPSGHALAANMISIVTFLDVFHGSDIMWNSEF